MVIVIKLGSSLLVNGDGEINKKKVLEIVAQVADLAQSGNKVIIVSSGAIASDPRRNRSSNLRSGVGQPKLMNLYSSLFDIYKLEVSQHLLTDREVFGAGREITRRTFLEAMEEKVIPIINGNDVVDDCEIRALEFCADNDRLFQSVCRMIKADAGVIGINGNGFEDENGAIINLIRSDEWEKIRPLIKEGSDLGHGNDGMRIEVQVLMELAKDGMIAILAPGKRINFITRSLAREKNFGTVFVP